MKEMHSNPTGDGDVYFSCAIGIIQEKKDRSVLFSAKISKPFTCYLEEFDLMTTNTTDFNWLNGIGWS